MDGLQLEAWAVQKAAQNQHFNPNWIPVVLYRNGDASGMGALFTLQGTPRILTAAHLFWEGAPPCAWTYRVLKPESAIRLPLISALPFANKPTADLAICTPGTALHVGKPIPNFYFQGAGWNGELQGNIWTAGENNKKIISTISGKFVASVGEVTYIGTPYEVLDYASEPGESGTVLYDENDAKTVYVLKGDSPELAKYCKSKGLCWSGKIAIALRLSIN